MASEEQPAGEDPPDAAEDSGVDSDKPCKGIEWDDYFMGVARLASMQVVGPDPIQVSRLIIIAKLYI